MVVFDHNFSKRMPQHHCARLSVPLSTWRRCPGSILEAPDPLPLVRMALSFQQCTSNSCQCVSQCENCWEALGWMTLNSILFVTFCPYGFESFQGSTHQQVYTSLICNAITVLCMQQAFKNVLQQFRFQWHPLKSQQYFKNYYMCLCVHNYNVIYQYSACWKFPLFIILIFYPVSE